MGIKERIEAEGQRLLLEAQNKAREAGLSLKSKIEEKVPVDTGELKRSWSFIEVTPWEFHVVSTSPYVKVAEYGLYPNPPKNPTGKTEGGFSIQAPKGFARISIREVINEFE